MSVTEEESGPDQQRGSHGLELWRAGLTSGFEASYCVAMFMSTAGTKPYPR